MLEVLRNKRDLHKTTAAALYDIPIEEVTKEQRYNGKTTNFTINYGGGAGKIAKVFGVPTSKGKVLRDKYFERYPNIRPFQLKSFNNAIKNGYISIDTLGRKWYLPHFDVFKRYESQNNILGKNASPRADLNAWKAQIERNASNAPIQGTAASMTKRAGIYLREYLLKNPSTIEFILPVHDEMVLECSIEEAPEAQKVLEECMARAANDFCSSVQIPAESIISKVWVKD